MAANIASCLKLTSWTDPENLVRKPGGFWQFSQVHWKHQTLQIPSSYLQPRRTASWHRPAASEVSCSYQKLPASNLEPGSFPASFDEAAALKKKSEEIEPYLNGRCIYLVGMMGSGKTTVGRILSDALGYSFFDSDTLVEQATGKSSVAEIFNLYGESFFREYETDVLKKLSIMHNLVVSTGGGVVIRPVNWKHMQKGITVWLDVPLEALARRIAAVGTESRPLLHKESNDAYAKTLLRLSTLLEERGDLYANANARVSLENIAAKLGYRDTCNLTPIVIAIEALTQILSFLKK